MASTAPKLKNVARATNRSASLRKAQRVSALERASEAWGEEPEVYGGGDEEERDDATRLAGRATEVGGKAVSGAGSVAKAVGTTGQVAGLGMQAAGVATEVAGKGAQALGSGVGAVGKALTATKVGAVIGAPLQALGLGAKVAGKGAEAGGKGAKATGKSVRKAGKKVRGVGKKAKALGGAAQSVGRQMGDLPWRDPDAKALTPSDIKERSTTMGRLRLARRKKRKGTQLEQSLERLRKTQAKTNMARMQSQSVEKQKGIRERFARLRARKSRRKKAKELKKTEKDVMKKFAGVWWIRSCWAWLMPSFGHSIYLINISFFIGMMEKWIGFYLPIHIPQIGEEWFFEQNAMLGRSNKNKKSKSSDIKIIIVKVFELLYMAFITFFVVAMDIFLLIMLFIIIKIVHKLT